MQTEREREGGGGEGLKGSAHFALQILVDRRTKQRQKRKNRVTTEALDHACVDV